MRAFFKSLERYGLIHFSDGAGISDILRYSYINSSGEICRVEEGCDEFFYQPLSSALLKGDV
jgi:hypothetical protein